MHASFLHHQLFQMPMLLYTPRATNFEAGLSTEANNGMRYLFVFVLIFFAACDPCRNLDCATDDYDAQFRIINAANNDLVFGQTPVYSPDAIQFYSLTTSDTTFYPVRRVYQPGTGYDSVLHVLFFPKADTIFLKLGAADVDTLRLQFDTHGTRCCGTITEITNLRLNNTTDLAGKGTNVIRK